MKGRKAFLGRRYCEVSSTENSVAVGFGLPVRHEGTSRRIPVKPRAAIGAYPPSMLAWGGFPDGWKTEARRRAVRVSGVDVQRAAAVLDGGHC